MPFELRVPTRESCYDDLNACGCRSLDFSFGLFLAAFTQQHYSFHQALLHDVTLVICLALFVIAVSFAWLGSAFRGNGYRRAWHGLVHE